MSTRRVVVLCALLVSAAWTAAASAQVAATIDQIPQRLRPAPAAVAPPQVARTSSDRTSVTQLPRDIEERASLPQDLNAEGGDAPAPVTAEMPAPLSAQQVRNAGSIDPDEIARLLDRGEAASIDAAAALATGAAPQTAPSVNESEGKDEDRRPSLLGVRVPPRT